MWSSSSCPRLLSDPPLKPHIVPAVKWGVPGETDTLGAGAGMGQHLHPPVPPHGGRGKVSLYTAKISPPVLGVEALPAPEQIFGEEEISLPWGEREEVGRGRWEPRRD